MPFILSKLLLLNLASAFNHNFKPSLVISCFIFTEIDITLSVSLEDIFLCKNFIFLFELFSILSIVNFLTLKFVNNFFI